MTIQRQNYETLGLPVGPYTHAVRHGDTVYTSGFTAFGTNAQMSGAGEQTHAVLAQLTYLAAQYDKTLADLVKVTVFVTDAADIPAVRDALVAGYGSAVPASSLVMVSGLFAPELRVEIEAVLGL
ncbi:MAG: Rid family hydrolase [Roseibium sp.]|uniref:RidA family protein n=1 Tax=Roseibium sp. TaxID=1936156 RepID=UPI003D9C66E4